MVSSHLSNAIEDLYTPRRTGKSGLPSSSIEVSESMCLNGYKVDSGENRYLTCGSQLWRTAEIHTSGNTLALQFSWWELSPHVLFLNSLQIISPVSRHNRTQTPDPFIGSKVLK